MSFLTTMLLIMVVSALLNRIARWLKLGRGMEVVLLLVGLAGILWYTNVYNSPQNKAYRTFNSVGEKFRNKVEKTFQPEKYAQRQAMKEPQGIDAVTAGLKLGWSRLTGDTKPSLKTLPLHEKGTSNTKQ